MDSSLMQKYGPMPLVLAIFINDINIESHTFD